MRIDVKARMTYAGIMNEPLLARASSNPGPETGTATRASYAMRQPAWIGLRASNGRTQYGFARRLAYVTRRPIA